MSAPKLVLYPTDADAAPTQTGLLRVLQDLELIGSSFELDARTHHYTGPAFLNHISFLGCSPTIELDAPAGALAPAARAGRFCHVQVLEATRRPRLRIKAGRQPRCRHCRTDIDPQPLLAQITTGMESTCPGCGRQTAVERLNWRQSGAIARIFLDIWGIHGAEAVPGDLLLQRLGHTTGGRWDFFYIED